jgi:putative two-component system response regulator
VNDKLLHPSRILVVDDQEGSALLLQSVLASAGYTAVDTVIDPGLVVARCTEEPPDLLVLDWHMPGRSGAGILEDIAFLTDEPNWMPVLVLTVDIAPDTKRQALSLGARDFLTKPIDVTEVLVRVRNLLHARYLRVELQRNNDLLHERVSQRTRELEDARLEMLDRLALAAEYRDDATGQHAERIGRTSELLALALGLDAPEAKLIGQAARLHDIGKIGIADELLLKPGKYTAEEFRAMKLHPAIGARILSGSTNELLMMAERIALTHHERWDGHGYPSGLAGEAIPLAGRIVTVADVFDALTHRRPYKEPWPVHVAVREIFSEAGTQFDPRVTEAFATLDHAALVQPAQAGVQAIAEAA